MSREIILARVRAATARTTDQPSRRDVTTAADGCAPSDVLDRFRRKAQAKGIEILEAGQVTDVPGIVAVYLDKAGAGGTLCVAPGIAPMEAWRTAGLQVREGSAEHHDTAGVSRASFGIAETGSLMLISEIHEPTTPALLPDIHILVLCRSKIVATFEGAFDGHRAVTCAPDVPHAIMFISGASRTGDIGGRIVMGAHGPRRLALILIERKQGA